MDAPGYRLPSSYLLESIDNLINSINLWDNLTPDPSQKLGWDEAATKVYITGVIGESYLPAYVSSILNAGTRRLITGQSATLVAEKITTLPYRYSKLFAIFLSAHTVTDEEVLKLKEKLTQLKTTVSTFHKGLQCISASLADEKKKALERADESFAGSLNGTIDSLSRMLLNEYVSYRSPCGEIEQNGSESEFDCTQVFLNPEFKPLNYFDKLNDAKVENNKLVLEVSAEELLKIRAHKRKLIITSENFLDAFKLCQEFPQFDLTGTRVNIELSISAFVLKEQNILSLMDDKYVEALIWWIDKPGHRSIFTNKMNSLFKAEILKFETGNQKSSDIPKVINQIRTCNKLGLNTSKLSKALNKFASENIFSLMDDLDVSTSANTLEWLQNENREFKERFIKKMDSYFSNETERVNKEKKHAGLTEENMRLIHRLDVCDKLHYAVEQNIPSKPSVIDGLKKYFNDEIAHKQWTK